MTQPKIDVSDRAFFEKMSLEDSAQWLFDTAKEVNVELEYSDNFDKNLVGEDEWGRLYAPAPGDNGLWTRFDMSLPEHRQAAVNTIREKNLVFLELYSEE